MAKSTVADVVSIDSDSDRDEDDGGVGEVLRSSATIMENRQITSTVADSTVVPPETLVCRSFWKAGDNFVNPKVVVTQAAPGMIEHARIHPKFLHSNATSDKWAFGAIAELLDNAIDEIQNGATFVKIDKINIVKDNSPALVFQDDGGGMDPNGIRKCMSLGYSSKKSNTTIGQYGNGFKTSTMRLGADAIVFSRSTREGKSTQSVGLLSYTFLRKTGQDDVIVPMIDLDLTHGRPEPIIYGSSEDWSTSLNILLKWFPFSTEDELLQQFEDIGTHGTKVIIYNLWLNDEGIYELSFDDDDKDIRLRDENAQDGKRVIPKTLELRSHISYRLRHSLRDYASMLYLKKLKNFKIILRGIPVEQFNNADELRHPESIMYKPHTATMEQAATEIKLGFIKEAPKLPIIGFNVYHKNRLIKRNAVADVVNLDSDDDEDAGRGVFRSLASLMEENRKAPSTIADANVADRETLECRSFWKAGENFVIPKAVTPTAPSLLEHARIHPKFLHSNATSHKWAFGAIAELLDNAVDEIQNGATFAKIDKINIVKDNSPALVFQDDGGGMDPDGIRKCMSLGYSSKKSNTTIGQYGNGFKTSTMRLGADAIVFSRSTRSGKSTQSVGLLSYTFLRRTGQDDVIVPMIDIDISTEKPQPIIYGSPEDWATNLETLLKWSPFSTEDELLQQFEDIGTHGTKVIIYNLWLNDEGIDELSFDDDDEDIRLRDESVHDGKRLNYEVLEQRSHISYHYVTPRAYASMLYLKKFKNFKIILCGVPVKQFNIADELRYPEIIKYEPHTATAEQATTEIKVGYIKEAPKLAICGYNVYHKNRLIRPFWKVTMEGSSLGHGVVGVLEANFIEPAHDKQDFERSSLFQRLEAKLKKIVVDYWPSHCEDVGYRQIYSGRSKKIAIPDQPPAVNTINPSPLPSEKFSQGGPIIREISHSNATSIRTVALAPPHMRNSSGLRSNFQPVHLNSRPVQLNTQPAATVRPVHLNPRPVQLNTQPAATDIENNLVGKSADEISQENIQLFMRCEEDIKKETEIEQMVRNIEKELEETKSKCAHLALLVDAKKKEMQQALS